MGEPISIRLIDNDEEALQQFAEDNGLSKGKALRQMMRQGLSLHGYEPTRQRYGRTRLQQLSREAWRGCIWAAGMLVAVDVASPVTFGLEAAVFLVAALVFQLVERNEPAVSDRLWPKPVATDGGERDAE